MDKRWRGSIPPRGRRLETWGDLPGEAVPRKFLEAEAAVPAGPPTPRQSPGRSPPTLAGSASSRPGAARLPRRWLRPPAPRSVQLFPLGDPSGGRERSPGPLGWEERRAGRSPAGALHPERPSAQGWHPPAQGRTAGQAPSWEGWAPEAL